MMKKRHTTSFSMQSVLDDVLKILIIVASHLLKNLFLTKMVSMKFNEIVENPYIYQHINITDFENINPLACLTKSQSSSIATSSVATSRPFTWWGCDTSSETTRKKPKLSVSRVWSQRAIK
ncbi:hypothetical protein D8674_011657 [Pyrus ussuriensis x Pyrus communis]|uniref:Uncharacterized protein n=1 Tax=Pyrus ussuriensis x Pyrus communis TaxID=2448454 RepID=A0A5N5FZC0_9ROSA|nr:hypothetical protein D8674_011657 [Pyrus ussuriensis x Pyrus communis]